MFLDLEWALNSMTGHSFKKRREPREMQREGHVKMQAAME